MRITTPSILIPMILTTHAGTINVPAGGDLQSYINQASPGDEIRFTTVSNCNAAIDKNLTITGMGANGSGYSDLTALDLRGCLKNSL
jgi:nitrous oxidase accessory protein NosD